MTAPPPSPKKLWQFPWGIPESALFVLGIALTGFLLQLTAGHFDFALLHAPGNFVALAILIGFILLGVRFQKTPLVRWLAGIPMAVTLIAALMLLALYMELTPQVSRLSPQATDTVSRLGFRMLTSSWPFVLLYSLTLVCLGIATLKRLLRFTRQDLAFVCNHLGLWVLLASAGLGAADMLRVVLYVEVGKTEWRVHSKNGETLELPIAITLRDFVMEEYPPNLALIDRQGGKPQPEGKPAAYYPIDPKRPEGRLGDWIITLDSYLHEAVRVGDGYQANPMPASTPAAKVTARHILSNETHTGWVSGGGKVPGFFSALPLDEHHAIVMTEPEPKRYASDISILQQGREPIDAILEVNKPVPVGDWMIYQYSYDTDAGKMSRYSAIELVYDPWLLPANIGMAFMAAGAFLLVWNGAGRRSKH